jgi:hypothetical protein
LIGAQEQKRQILDACAVPLQELGFRRQRTELFVREPTGDLPFRGQSSWSYTEPGGDPKATASRIVKLIGRYGLPYMQELVSLGALHDALVTHPFRNTRGQPGPAGADPDLRQLPQPHRMSLLGLRGVRHPRLGLH